MGGFCTNPSRSFFQIQDRFQSTIRISEMAPALLYQPHMSRFSGTFKQWKEDVVNQIGSFLSALAGLMGPDSRRESPVISTGPLRQILLWILRGDDDEGTRLRVQYDDSFLEWLTNHTVAADRGRLCSLAGAASHVMSCSGAVMTKESLIMTKERSIVTTKGTSISPRGFVDRLKATIGQGEILSTSAMEPSGADLDLWRWFAMSAVNESELTPVPLHGEAHLSYGAFCIDNEGFFESLPLEILAEISEASIVSALEGMVVVHVLSWRGEADPVDWIDAFPG